MNVKRVISSPRFKSFLQHGWRIGLTLALLWVVFKQVNLGELWVRIAETSWWVLAALILLEVFLSWLGGWRWAILALDKPTNSEIRAFYNATMVGQFYNLFMPSSMGGDLVKWTSLTHLNLSKSRLVFTMLLDRVMGMMGLIFWGFVGVLLARLWHVAQVPDVMVWLFGGMFIGMLGFFIFVYSPLQLKHFPFINKIGLLVRMEDYLAAHKRAFWRAFTLGLIMQALWLVLIYGLALEVGFKTNIWQFFVIQPVVSAVITLPISFAGFGATEAGFLYFYQQLGELPTTIIALTTLLAICRFGIGIIGWLTGVTNKLK